MEAKIPGKTGWLDVGTAYSSNNPTVDGAGALDGADPGNPATLLFIWNGTAEDDVTSGRQAAFTANGTAYTITFTDGATDSTTFSGGAATLKANPASQASIRTALTTLLDVV